MRCESGAEGPRVRAWRGSSASLSTQTLCGPFHSPTNRSHRPPYERRYDKPHRPQHTAASPAAPCSELDPGITSTYTTSGPPLPIHLTADLVEPPEGMSHQEAGQYRPSLTRPYTDDMADETSPLVASGPASRLKRLNTCFLAAVDYLNPLVTRSTWRLFEICDQRL